MIHVHDGEEFNCSRPAAADSRLSLERHSLSPWHQAACNRVLAAERGVSGVSSLRVLYMMEARWQNQGQNRDAR